MSTNTGYVVARRTFSREDWLTGRRTWAKHQTSAKVFPTLISAQSARDASWTDLDDIGGSKFSIMTTEEAGLS